MATKGKRAAFALFYGPMHYFVVAEIVRAIPHAQESLREIIDVGCGTGAAGAAWAIEAQVSRVSGFDRNPWAVGEANRTYRDLNLNGRARQGNIDRFRTHAGNASGIIVAYAVNELPGTTRNELRAELLRAHARAARVLIVEPIATRTAPWWNEWRSVFVDAGGHSNEWRFPANLPVRQRELARAAGLDPRELTARSLWI